MEEAAQYISSKDIGTLSAKTAALEILCTACLLDVITYDQHIVDENKSMATAFQFPICTMKVKMFVSINEN